MKRILAIGCSIALIFSALFVGIIALFLFLIYQNANLTPANPVQEARRRLPPDQLKTLKKMESDGLLRPERVELKADQEAILKKLESAGLLRLDAESHKAFISPLIWLELKLDAKADATYVLALACGNRSMPAPGYPGYWVDVFDDHSGKKLAEFSRVWGFKVYP